MAAQYSQDANQRAWWIAYYETPTLSDKSPRADALRAGAPLPEDDGLDVRETLGDVGRQIVEGGEALARAAGSEVSEFDDLKRSEIRERLHQMILGAATGRDPVDELYRALANGEMPDPGTLDPGTLALIRAIEGLLGNEVYRGTEHPSIDPLPGPLREYAGSFVDDVTDPVTAGVTAGGVAAAILSLPALPVLGAAVGLGWLADDLLSDDSNTVDLFRALLSEGTTGKELRHKRGRPATR